MKFFLLSIFVVIMSFNTFAQVFSVKGDFRFRPEFRNGYKNLPDSGVVPAFFVAQRVRLSINYSSERFSLGVVLHENNVWGDKKLTTNSASVGFFNAWAGLHFSKKNKIVLGRQVLNFDNGRLFSRSSWSQTGRAHDLIRFDHDGEKHNYSFAVAWNQIGEKNSGIDYNNSLLQVRDNYLALALGHYEFKSENASFSALAVADAFQATDSSAVYVRVTGGGGYSTKINNWGAKAYAYFQAGETQFSQAIQAWYANAEIQCYLNQFSINAGAEVLSGNKENDSKYRQFIPLYGSGHTFNGYADYFSNYKTATSGKGLTDLYLKLKYTINDKNSVELRDHNFFLQKDIYDDKDKLQKHLANEIDLIYELKPFDECKMSVGYSLVASSKTMRIIQDSNSKLGNWFFVILELDPEIFKKN